MIVRSSDAIIAIGGVYGTLSEIAFGLVLGKPVVALNNLSVTRPGATQPDSAVQQAMTAEEAVEWVERQLA